MKTKTSIFLKTLMADLFVDDLPASTSFEAPDASERERALDIRSSWIVEAPAGSGKTGLLIQRYLKLLADESVTSPEQVLAITFTRKATAEMRERVLNQLQSAAAGREPENEFDRATRPFAREVLVRSRVLGWQLIQQPRRLNIRTIDAVCSEIAGSLPVLSASGGSRTIVEDATPLYAAAANRTFLELGGPDSVLDHALRLVLLHRDGNLADCERLLATMLKLRDQWGDLVPVGRDVDESYLESHIRPKLERSLEHAVCSALTQLVKVIPGPLLEELTRAAAEMARIEGYNAAPSPIAICANKNQSPQDRAEDLSHWQALVHLLITKESNWRKSFNKNHLLFMLGRPEHDRLRALINELQSHDDLLAAVCAVSALPPAEYPEEQWVVIKALFRVLNRALAELQIVFAERAECDYPEVALAARIALTNVEGAHDLEEAFGMKLQHILVDEMQDTSSSQYELIQMLTAHFDGRGQTVFLVGDPKQSIYLFREARLERFLRIMATERLGTLRVGHLRLTANFRSQANLVARLNEDFVRIFPRSVDTVHTVEVSFTSASAIRPPDPSAAARVWHPAILPSLKTGEKPTARRDEEAATAREIRDLISGWRSRPLPAGRSEPWRIAILVRNRNHLRAIVGTLKDARLGRPIPFRAVEIEPLKERTEIQDLSALTRALLHPADRIAWLAVLHAPWCGLALTDLYTLTGEDDFSLAERTLPSLIAERGELLGTEAIQRLERIWPVLEAAIALRTRAPLSQIVERTWRSLGGDAICNASELANAYTYLQLLAELESEPSAFSIVTLEKRLERLFAAPVVDPTAIDIMTIHKAKGLEWDVVIVPGLHLKTRSNRGELLSWVELDSLERDSQKEQSAHFALAPIEGKGEDSHQLKSWVRGIRSARETAENKRLFYVACTRAREELHLFAAPELSSKGLLLPVKGTLLEAAWPAAESFFTAALATSRAEPAASRLVAFPSTAAALTEPGVFDMAAAAAAKPSAVLKRLPLAFNPAARFLNPDPLPYGNGYASGAASHFERPEGSVPARAFGNTIHALFELLATRLASGESAAYLVANSRALQPRITALLRSEGLQPTLVERLTSRALDGLEATLKDPAGLWILSPQKGAASEHALTALSYRSEARTEFRTEIRIDRLFRAGPQPHAAGNSHLWIVDYKTTSHGAEGLDTFLAQERARYAPQLASYAAILAQSEPSTPIRLALYYPMLSRLVWWEPELPPEL